MYKDTTIFAKARLYSDGSGIETGVAYDPTFIIEGDRYVTIKGVGDPISVRLDHVDQLISWLREAQRAAKEG